MKTKIIIIALLSVLTVAINAQTYKNTYTPSAQQEQEAIRSPQLMHTNVHEGTIYEPFSNTTPSEQSEVGASYSAAKAPGGPRRIGNFDNVPEGGEQENSYPVGEPWVLAVFALAFGGVIFLRRRRAS